MESTPLDPVIDEIREVRRQISARFNHDPMRLVQHYMRLQQEYRDRLLGAVRDEDQTDSASQTQTDS